MPSKRVVDARRHCTDARVVRPQRFVDKNLTKSIESACRSRVWVVVCTWLTGGRGVQRLWRNGCENNKSLYGRTPTSLVIARPSCLAWKPWCVAAVQLSYPLALPYMPALCAWGGACGTPEQGPSPATSHQKG